MMSREQVGELLLLASVLDKREINVPMLNLWHKLIGHLRFETAEAALYAHMQASRFPPHPADILEQSRIAAARRRELGVQPTPPPGRKWAVDVIESTPTKAIER